MPERHRARLKVELHALSALDEVVIFNPSTLPLRKAPCIHWICLVGPQKYSGNGGKKKNFQCPCHRI
jgi:hypothetical protein